MSDARKVSNDTRNLKVYSDLSNILSEQNISLKQLADRINPEKSYYNSLWQSIRNQTTKFETLEKIAEVLGVVLVVEYRSKDGIIVEEPRAIYKKSPGEAGTVEMAYRETIDALKGALKDKERIIELQEKFIQTKK